MITLPMSDYPAPSNESAQMQVLSERKGEIAQQMQNVQDSSLDEGRKTAITDNLKAQSNNLNVEIHHKQVEKDYKEKLVAGQVENQRVENKALEKQVADTSKSQALLDTRA
jgi:hypothetical protein